MAAPIRRGPPAIGLPHERNRPRLGVTTEPVQTRATFVPSPLSVRGFQYHYDDIIQVNPVLEQPKLIFYSLAQPIIRWGHRRFVRPLSTGAYGMRAGPRFFGRWAYVGIQLAQFRDRGKTAGVQGRPFTYSYPPPQGGPGSQRTQSLISYAAAGMPAVGGSTIRYELAQPSQSVLGIPGPVIIRGGSRAPQVGR